MSTSRHKITLPMDELAGMVIQSTLYGIYLVLFYGALYIFFGKRNGKRPPIDKFLMVLGFLLFVLITAEWIVQISRLFDAFIYNDAPGGAQAVYEAANATKSVVKTAFYVLQMAVGDTTMVYRLYIVWGKNLRIIILPVITTLTLFIAGVNVVISFAREPPHVNIFTSTSGHWVVTIFACTLFTNVLVTGLISWRIWRISRRLDVINRKYSAMPIAQILIESAALYTSFLLLTNISYFVKAPIHFAYLDATSPAIGISFAMIIVRVGLKHGSREYDISVSSSIMNELRADTSFHSETHAFDSFEVGNMRHPDTQGKFVIKKETFVLE